MKIYNAFIPLFRDYNLTELITTSKGKKKLTGDNLAIYHIVDEFLADYGIRFSMSTKYIDSDITVRAMRLDKDFPLENYPIIEQCSGYTNAKVYIGLEVTDYHDISFLFDTETKSCTLHKQVWGEIRKEAVFNSFADLWTAKKEVESYEELFKEELV